MAGPQEALLSGKCPNGLIMERHIRLTQDWVRTSVTARNPTNAPLEALVMLTAELAPGDIDKARVRFHSAGGADIDKQLIVPAEPPEGSATYGAADIPDGEWRLVREGRGDLANRFPRDLVDRVTVSWSVKGVPRVTFAVYSKKRTLAPGETLKLESDYR